MGFWSSWLGDDANISMYHKPHRDSRGLAPGCEMVSCLGCGAGNSPRPNSPRPNQAGGCVVRDPLRSALRPIAGATKHLCVIDRTGPASRERDDVVDLELVRRPAVHTRPTIPIQDEPTFLFRPHPTTAHAPARRTTPHSQPHQQQARHTRQRNNPEPGCQIHHRQPNAEPHHHWPPHRNSCRSDTCQSSPGTSYCTP